MRTPRDPARLTVRALEDQGFRNVMIGKVVPLEVGAVQNLHILCNEVVKDNIAGYSVIFEVDGTRVAKPQRPVVQRALDRLPETGKEMTD
jgi:hypothetical protein